MIFCVMSFLVLIDPNQFGSLTNTLEKIFQVPLLSLNCYPSLYLLFHRYIIGCARSQLCFNVNVFQYVYCYIYHLWCNILLLISDSCFRTCSKLISHTSIMLIDFCILCLEITFLKVIFFKFPQKYSVQNT